MTMFELSHKDQACHNVLPIMNDHHHMLRKAVSDVTKEINKISRDLETIEEFNTADNKNINTDDETNDDEDITLQEECECCGLKEECTRGYVARIRKTHSGKWVCGLCSEAVKERLTQPEVAIEEAVTNHMDFLREFNTTTRVNPKLSFASAMRGIARRNSEKRLTGSSRIMRTSSCVPRINI